MAATTSKTIPPDMVNLRLILVSGRTKEFVFSPNTSAADIATHVFDTWPEEKESSGAKMVQEQISFKRQKSKSESEIIGSLSAGKLEKNKKRKEFRRTKKINMEKLAKTRKILFEYDRANTKLDKGMHKDELPGGGSVSAFIRAFKKVRNEDDK